MTSQISNDVIHPTEGFPSPGDVDIEATKEAASIDFKRRIDAGEIGTYLIIAKDTHGNTLTYSDPLTTPRAWIDAADEGDQEEWVKQRERT